MPHTQYGNFAPLLPKLETRHDARIATDKEFQWWNEDVEQFRAEAAKKYISLNEATRRAERERQDAQRKERQVQRKALGLALDPLADDSSDDGLTGNERDIVRMRRARRLPRSARTRCCASRRRSWPTR